MHRCKGPAVGPLLWALAGLVVACSDNQGDSEATSTSDSGNGTVSSATVSTSSGSSVTSSSVASSASTTSASTTASTASTSASSTSLSASSTASSSSAATTGAGGGETAVQSSSASTTSTETSTGGGPSTSDTSSTGQGGSTSDATSSQTSGGGTGGSGSYQPCPTNGEPCIILPFGDSITDGVGSSNQAGYRPPLFQLAVEANRNITFVGSLSNGPDQVAGQQFPKNHEGHSGWTIDSGYVSFGEGISTLIPSPAFNTIPHIVLLMIGTNDVSADHGTDTIADRLETLLDDIVATAPDALVVVAIPTPIGWNPAALQTYSARIPEIVEARVAQGEHMVVADMSQMPANNLNSDDLHPNDQGYVYMANVWYSAIESVLPE